MTLEKAVEIWKEALEKQIAKRPHTDQGLDFRCPRCGFGVDEEHNEYGGNCGQKIEWSEEE